MSKHGIGSRPSVLPLDLADGGPDPVAVARGLLSTAIERCEPGSEAGLEICAAWEELEEPGTVPDVVDAATPPAAGPVELLAQARSVLLAAIPSVQPAMRAIGLGSAVQRIDAAMTALVPVVDGDDPAAA